MADGDRSEGEYEMVLVTLEETVKKCQMLCMRTVFGVLNGNTD